MCKLKQSRLLCLLFVLILCFQSFGLNVSAASDKNLIDSNLSNWDNGNEYNITVTPSGGVYRLTLADSSPSTYFGFLLTDTSLIAGHSYSLTFKLPSRTECNEAFGNSYSASVYNNHFENSVVLIGVGFIDASGNMNSPNDFVLYTIDKTNYTNYFGKTLRASFVASTYSGTPCIYICLTSTDSAKHTFYFSNFSLYDNDDNSAELTGIKGFLHSIRWDLVGGCCDEEDCPHSIASNPHQSLSARMSAGFTVFFDNVQNSFTNLGTNISNLGTSIGTWFSNLGDRFTNSVTDFKTNVTIKFDDMRASWSEWIDSLKLKFEAVGDSIKNKFEEIGDNFTAFFEKFKPRVSVNLNWHRGAVNHDTGEIDVSKIRVYTTELFNVTSDTVYYVSYNHFFAAAAAAEVHQYDLKGNYIGCIYSSKNAFEGYVLPAGYQYRFSIHWLMSWDQSNDAINEVFSVYAEEGWINAVIFNFRVGLIELFVPNDAAIENMKNDLNEVLQNHLGIVYTCSELVIDFLANAFDIILSAPDEFSLVIPDVNFEVAGITVPVFNSQSVDFSFMESAAFQRLYSLYKVALYIFFGGIEVKYALATYRKVINN